jgi:hypothetical protein
MSIGLQTAPAYPFNLDGPLCPLLNNAELLATFYAEDSLRHGIKNFCKKAGWPGKPVVSFAINPEKLQELMLSLFNTPAARATLSRQSEAGHGVYLNDAIWQWFITTNPTLDEWVLGYCHDIKGKSFIKPESLQKLLTDFQRESPAANIVTQLACVVLAFAIVQPDDRYRLGETFLSAFPEYAERFCGSKAPGTR